MPSRCALTTLFHFSLWLRLQPLSSNSTVVAAFRLLRPPCERRWSPPTGWPRTSACSRRRCSCPSPRGAAVWAVPKFGNGVDKLAGCSAVPSERHTTANSLGSPLCLSAPQHGPLQLCTAEGGPAHLQGICVHMNRTGDSGWAAPCPHPLHRPVRLGGATATAQLPLAAGPAV